MSAPEAQRWPESTPLVSLVTPCLNSAAFLEATIESVAAQDYPRIEHIVVDGGSTDGTLEILARYRNLTVLTGPDHGAPEAVNRGFRQARGEFFNYLNSDDILLPGAISSALRALQDAPQAAGVYGDAWWIDEQGKRLAPYPVRDFDPQLLARECFLCQPASLLRSRVYDEIGGLNPEFDVAFDYEFWMRLVRTHELKRIPATLACSRMHRANKSLSRRAEVFLEGFRALQRHYGYVPFRWVYSYVCHRADGRDQFFEPLQPSVARYLESLPAGLSVNRGARRRYVAEWLKVMSWSGLRRRLQVL